MKSIRKGNEVSVKLSLPKDVHWKIFGSLLGDLGFGDLEGRDDTQPILNDSEFYDSLHSAIRKRDPLRLLEAVATRDPRCMVTGPGGKSAEAYRCFAYHQVGSFLKKFPFNGIDTNLAARKAFLASELECKNFNSENFASILALSERHPDYLGVVEELQQDISSLLGEFPNYERILGCARHGPGASIGTYSEGRVTSYFKWSILPYSVTTGALPLAKTAILADPRWIGALDDWYRSENSVPVGAPIDLDHFWSKVFTVATSSKITYVPKTVLTDRTIAIEPLLNVYLQLGVDAIIRARLKARWGIDINTQELNQKLAEEGSISGEFATVDLSAASDSISLKICEMLLPPAWYGLLLDLRSPFGDLEGIEIPFEKISSMGNGFTFALETLIFAAIARCAIRRTRSRRVLAVYGDDIVLPSTAYNMLQELLSLCGFSVNSDKSFTDGSFRESCGADFYSGYNVRPVFLKRPVKNVVDLFYIHNALWTLQSKLHWAWGVDLTRTLRLIRNWIPSDIRKQFHGPPCESLDTHLFSDGVLSRNSYGQRVHWGINPRPRVFNNRTKFYFRKLMNQLRGPIGYDPWDYRQSLDTGNAFDVTKRGHTVFRCVRFVLP